MANLNLSTGQVLPGVYGYVDYNAQGSGQPANLSCLLWGYVSATATQPLNQPFRAFGALDAANKCGGANTDAARAYAAAMSQPESQGADVWIMPIVAPSGGTASVYKITVYVAATNPTAAGTIQLWIASQQIPAVGFSTTDTATTIGAALATAILAAPNVPITTCTASSGVLTITYIHKGTTGEDFPVRCNVSPSGSGVTVSPGQATFATNASGAGSVSISFGALTVTTSIADADTPAQIATKVVNSFNANSYPVTAVVDGSSTSKVDFLFQNNWDVRRMSGYVVTSTGTTMNLGSGVTNGIGTNAVLTYNGTLGVGAPSITQALTNLSTSSQYYRSWMCPWTDATTIGALASQIVTAENGSITGQKLQILTVADFQALTVDGAIPLATSPNLTTSNPYFAFGWSPDCPVQAFELASRVAAARASMWVGTPQFNWNGWRFQGNQQAPILLPPTTPSKDTLNSALRTYGLSPWVVGRSGNLEVVKGRTTSLAGDMRLWAWSTEAQAAYHVFDLTNVFTQNFQGGSIVRYTDPKAPGLFDAQSFIDVMQDRMLFWERNGNYDGAKLLAPAVKASPNAINVFRMDCQYPESPVLDLDQVVFSGTFTQPSS